MRSNVPPALARASSRAISASTFMGLPSMEPGSPAGPGTLTLSARRRPDLTRSMPRDEHDAIPHHIPPQGDRKVDGIDGRHREALEQALAPVAPAGRNLALAQAREPHRVLRQLDSLHLPAAGARVMEQPAAGAADVEQSSGGEERCEIVEQAAVLGDEGGFVEGAGRRAAATIVGLEIVQRIHFAERTTGRLNREESHPADGALDQREARSAELVDHGERPQPIAVTDQAALEGPGLEGRGVQAG